MNELEIAEQFIKLARLRKEAEQIETNIREYVLETGESMKLAGVQATYYKPSMDYDYEGAVKRVMTPDFDLKPYTTIIEKVRWKEVATFLDFTLDEIPCEEKPARVVIK